MTIFKITLPQPPLLNGPDWHKRSLDTAAIAFWLAVASFVLSSIWNWGVLEILVGSIGTASCGFAWILARSFFRPNVNRDIWPIYLVGVLIALGILLRVFATARTGEGTIATGLSMAASLQTLLSSTVLILAFLEPWLNYQADFPLKEKRFRLLYSAFYGGLFTISCLWLSSVSEGSWAERSGDTIKVFCAIIAAAASACGWYYRRLNPLPKQKRRQRTIAVTTDAEQDLSRRILAQLQEREPYLEPDLKLSDLAEILGECDHKVRNCITGVLEFRNFNHLINHYRIGVAKKVLGNPSKDGVSILSIAFDCGFSSIGPFNRAFKQETGQTPSSFRRSKSN